MPTDGILDSVLSDWQGGILAFYPALLRDGLILFGVIALLQFSFVAAKGALAGNVFGLGRELMMGIIRLGIVWGVLAVIAGFGSSVVLTCQDIAASAGGISPGSLTPSGVYNIGLTIIGQLWAARTWMAWFDITDDILFCIVVAMTWVTYIAAALFYLWFLIQTVYVVTIGAVTLPWAAFEPAFPTLHQWAEDVLRAGMRLLACLLMLVIGENLAAGWAATFSGLGKDINNAQLYYALEAFGEAVIFLALIAGVPLATGRMMRVQGGGMGAWEREPPVFSHMESAHSVAHQSVVAGSQLASQGTLAPYVRSRLLS